MYQELEYSPPTHEFKMVPSSLCLPSYAPVPADEEIQRAAEPLNAGEKVAMLIGQGARGARREVEQAAEVLGAGVAKEIASRTVNKERARSGEAESASRQSIEDMSSSRRGGLRSHAGAEGPTKDQLYAEAQRRNIKGRSHMNKAELEKALGR